MPLPTLPLALVNKILLYRPTHPTALLIQDFTEYYNRMCTYEVSNDYGLEDIADVEAVIAETIADQELKLWHIRYEFPPWYYDTHKCYLKCHPNSPPALPAFLQ